MGLQDLCLGFDKIVSSFGMCYCHWETTPGLQTFYCTSRILVFAISSSIIDGITPFFFLRARNNILDIIVHLEYFIFTGDRSYLDRRCVGHQYTISRALRANLLQIARSLFERGYRIILNIQTYLAYFNMPGNTSYFAQKAF